MFVLQTFTLTSEQCFRLLFASNIVGLFGFLMMLASLWRERRSRRSKVASRSQFVVFHVYEPILYLLLACSVTNLCLLAAPGPFPAVPQWFYGADFKGGVMDAASVVEYWLYWFVFELMATGFGVLFLFDVLLANTFVKALLIGMAWAAVAATSLAIGFSHDALGFPGMWQTRIDAATLFVPSLLFVVLLFKASRPAVIPYAVFSLMWRIVLCSATYNNVMWSFVGAVVYVFRSVGQPLIMFTTLVVDTRDQNAMISDLVNDSDAIVVAPTALPPIPRYTDKAAIRQKSLDKAVAASAYVRTPSLCRVTPHGKVLPVHRRYSQGSSDDDMMAGLENGMQLVFSDCVPDGPPKQPLLGRGGIPKGPLKPSAVYPKRAQSARSKNSYSEQVQEERWRRLREENRTHIISPEDLEIGQCIYRGSSEKSAETSEVRVGTYFDHCPVTELRESRSSGLSNASFRVESPKRHSKASSSSREEEAASLLTPSKMVKRSVAIKVLVPQAGITQHRVKLVLEETQISAALKTHPNIVKYYGICVDPPKIMLVFEYCNPGNLYEFMAGCDPEAEGFDFSVRLQLASQGAAALAYMHSFESPIIHRDVKSPNFLVSSPTGPMDTWTLKLCDFGISVYRYDNEYFTEKAGTYLWMAPEVFNSSPYDESVDIFSFAVVMWELLTLQRPYPGMQESQVYDHVVVRGNRLAVPARLRAEHPRYCELMEQCWHEDPKQRLTAEMLAIELESLLSMGPDVSPENSD